MSEIDLTIAEASASLVHEATCRGISIGCAESCTGGMVASSITGTPGSSAVFMGGIVSYAIAVKQSVLGVEDWIFEDESLGAVSAPCAEQMSSGACRALGCDAAVSTTGIAGPTGAEPGKPVGTVWFGVSAGSTCKSEVVRFDGDRESVRKQATLHAIQLLREAIVGI